MKKVLFFSFLLWNFVGFAQLSVGKSIPDPSAQLDVVSSNKGVLLPRIALTGSDDLTTIVGGNVDGLLIYNTTNGNGITPGFYYWNNSGSKWVQIQTDSTAYSIDLDSKANLASPTFTGTVSGIDKTMVGLANVDNTSDVNKPVSTATQTALNSKANLASPTFTGTVSGIDKTMVGLTNVDNTSDVNKPVSTATQTVLNSKANLASPTFTGTVSGIDKTMVGLANVDNTSDANKPISTATQTALNSKANLASPTFTGTVSGIDKTMVGLANVDNTSDISKPVSTATQTALNSKANLASPTFTGTPTLPTGTIGVTQITTDNSTALATTAFVKAVVTASTANVADAITDGTTTVAPSQNAVFDALALKANVASPTFTGTVSGIDKTMVGLANIDNTSDANKPVSTATQTELNLKANLASPTFTGTPTLPTGTTGITQLSTDNSTALATTAFVKTVASSNVADAITDGITTVAPSQNAVFDDLALKANLASPIFTGTVSSSGTQESTASTNGSLKIDGGVGIAKNLQIGSNFATTNTQGTLMKINSSTIDLTGTGPTSLYSVLIRPSTYTSSTSVGFSSPATFAIEGPPTFSGSVTAANPLAFLVGGKSHFSGLVVAAGSEVVYGTLSVIGADTALSLQQDSTTSVSMQSTFASGTASGVKHLNINTTSGDVTIGSNGATVRFPGLTTGVTQVPGNNSTALATTAFVTNAVSSSIPDATTLATGKVQLAGDLTGTAAAPIVAAINLASEAGDTTNYLAFANNATSSQALKTNNNLMFNGVSGVLTTNSLELNSSNALTLVNSGTMAAKNSSGSLNAFITPRTSDNRTLISYDKGIHVLNNNGSGVTLSNTNMYFHENGKIGIGSFGRTVSGTAPSTTTDDAPTSILQVGQAGNTDINVAALRVYQSGISTPTVWKGAGGFGGSNASVVAGELNSSAVIGGYNPALSTPADLAIGSTGTTKVSVKSSFATEGALYARAPRVHVVTTAIVWAVDDVVLLLTAAPAGNIVFPSASAYPNRLVAINNRSGSNLPIANTSGGDTGVYANEGVTIINNNSGVTWWISHGTSWRLYSGRPD